MKTSFRLLALSSLLLVAFESCKKDTVTETPDPTPTPTETGNLVVEFKNTVDLSPLVYGQKYLNPSGDTFKVSKFNYYISKIVLTREDNSVYIQPDSYRIIQQGTPSSMLVQVANVPVGNYKSIKLMLGVDSAKNNSGAHSGGLDFNYASDMFWGWNTGYIFLKLEGTAPTSTLSNGYFEYHIGGYGGINKTQRTYDLGLTGTTANVTTAKTPTINLVTDVNELFKNPTVISFSTLPSVVSAGANAKKIADNYADMIRFEKVQNP